MNDFSLKSRAIAFAVAAGAATFLLAFATGIGGDGRWERVGAALVLAMLCGLLCWIAARRSLTAMVHSLDMAIERLAKAAGGDLQGPIPARLEQALPPLANAMSGLFRQFHSDLEGIRRLAWFDPVTGLANRANFRSAGERMILGLAEDEPAALYFVDLDRFKSVNDTWGHATGDALLAMVATRLRGVGERFSAARAGRCALIGRLSGDEFTMIFPGVGDPDDANRIGSAILNALSEPFPLADQQASVGASIGIAMRPRHGKSLSELMSAADAAMYHAKANGRGRIEHFSAGLAAEMRARARLENDLREALDRDQFQLVFQPQVDARSGAVVGAEALLRWSHPGGMRLPDSFIQRAEESGLIVDIGDWVVGTVAATIRRWADIGVEQRLAVNVSPRQIDHEAFFRRLRAALKRADAPARLLELEISESLAMHCSDEMIDAIAELRRDGASVAIDDFGTGYSKLSRLRELPVDRVKLDRSLVENVVTRRESRVIAQAVIALIHGLDCEAVAEGIESTEQADVLRIIGCDVLQGFAIAPPMEERRFLEWMGGARRDQSPSARSRISA